MNDFTKDELESIYLDMNYNILKAGKNNVDQFYLKLRDKVEAMINNFCEHEKICFYFIEKQNLAVEQCVKCQVWGATTSDDNNE